MALELDLHKKSGAVEEGSCGAQAWGELEAEEEEEEEEEEQRVGGCDIFPHQVVVTKSEVVRGVHLRCCSAPELEAILHKEVLHCYC